jgi:hypothetical protein
VIAGRLLRQRFVSNPEERRHHWADQWKREIRICALRLASLQTDALDFLGDAADYGISLLVVGMALRYRASAARAMAAANPGALGSSAK